uniref:Uncharacterized protein n=1 Tax=Timema tahoe TaxID=61484 RepID=A0A7R9ILX5_9NEOP|nr:unnamed protein product [Timema tahoe]
MFDCLSWLTINMFDCLIWLTTNMFDCLSWLTTSMFDRHSWLTTNMFDCLSWLTINMFDCLSWLTINMGDLAKCPWFVAVLYRRTGHPGRILDYCAAQGPVSSDTRTLQTCATHIILLINSIFTILIHLTSKAPQELSDNSTITLDVNHKDLISIDPISIPILDGKESVGKSWNITVISHDAGYAIITANISNSNNRLVKSFLISSMVHPRLSSDLVDSILPWLAGLKGVGRGRGALPGTVQSPGLVKVCPSSNLLGLVSVALFSQFRRQKRIWGWAWPSKILHPYVGW